MPDSPPSKRMSRGRKIAWALGVIIAVVLVLAVALAIVVDHTRLAAIVQDRVLASTSRTIGRKITAGPPDVKLLPPAVTLSDVRVEGVGDEPLVFIETIRVRVAIWPLLRSLGKEVHLTEVTLNRPVANLLRRDDSRWAHQEVLDRWEPGEGEVILDKLTVNDGEVRVVDLSSPNEPFRVAMSGIEVTVSDYGVGRPLSLSLQSASPELHVKLQLDELPDGFANLPPEQWPNVQAQLSLRGFSLDEVRGLLPAGAGEVMRGGRVALDAKVETTEQRSYVLSGTTSVDDLHLRSEPAQLSANFSAQIPAGQPEAFTAELTRMQVRGPGVELEGRAQLEGTDASRIRFAIEGPRLDLGALLAAMHESETSNEPALQSEELLSPQARQRLARSTVEGTASIARVTNGALVLNDLEARMTLRQGVLTLEQARAGLHGGTIDVAGTRIDLDEDVPEWTLAANLGNVELGSAFAGLSGVRALDGLLSGTLKLEGAGADWEAVREALDGSGRLQVENGELQGLDLGAELRRELAVVSRALGREVPVPEAKREPTRLGDFTTGITIDDGWIHLTRPIAFDAPVVGKGRVTGRIGLNRALDLEGTVSLPPEFVASATSGRFTPEKPVDVPLQIGGTAESPTVSIDPVDLAAALAPKSFQRIERGLRERLGF